MEIFDPNDIGLPNGNFFALPYSTDESEIVLVAVPWDVTTSYRAGTAKGPQAIVEASAQIDLFDEDVNEAWKIKIGTHEFNKAIFSQSEDLRRNAEDIIHFLEEGGNVADDKSILQKQTEINAASNSVNNWVYEQSKKYAEEGKIVGVVGGEHSVPFGLIKLMNDTYDNFGVLHIDAHADLRESYEGFEFSHASIMYNVVKHCNHLSKLVQVGIRDFCQDEFDLINSDNRIESFTDNHICDAVFAGEKTWKNICDDIINRLPQNVYISFDIDGLSPDLCPHTGTPVPGGLSYRQACYLLKTLAKSGKKIIAFDINEVAPDPNGNDEYDANIGARILYKLCCLTHLANNK